MMHPIVENILQQRGLEAADYSDFSVNKLIHFSEIANIDHAAKRLLTALTEQESILIAGDFDADGATSSTVLLKGLRSYNPNHLDYVVPDRMTQGYGLTPALINSLKNRPDIIITVDNGIASFEGIELANQLGITVIVTDHHLPAEKLPDAYAIVNPNCEENSTLKNLAGVGVTFYLLMALRKHAEESGWFEQQQTPKPSLGALLDLVALGTVADVVPLDYNNQILVEQGLRRIRAGKACAGIQALLQVSDKEAEYLSTSDLGYSIGPRLNAAGRMDDMSIGIECLLSNDQQQALHYASILNELNLQRRDVETDIKNEALRIVAGFEYDIDDKVGAICLHRPDWHAGVIGIVASRIRDRYHRPTIIFANHDDGTLKGSGRSLTNIHMRDMLVLMDSMYPGSILQFGGHAMAAGLKIEGDQFDLFQQRFNQLVLQEIDPSVFTQTIQNDGSLATQAIDLPMVNALKYSIPWGKDCPEPMFVDQFKVLSTRILKEKHMKFTVTPLNDERTYDAIAFNLDDPHAYCQQGDQVELNYRLDINRYRQSQTIQLMVEKCSVVP